MAINDYCQNSYQQDELGDDVAPWYRQPWFWFVMSPLLVVLCACTVMISLAVIYADDRVVGNYYKEGLLINERMDEAERARRLGITATMRIDHVTGELVLQLTQTAKQNWQAPESLRLMLAHPSEQSRDQHIVLRRGSANNYVGDAEEALSHRWYLTLMPDSEATEIWRIQSEANFSEQESVTFQPL